MNTALHPGKLILLLFVGSLCLGAWAWASPGLGSSTIEPGDFMCIFDRAKLLALDEYSFDQDMNGGWRAIAQHEVCTEIAADLIREYRETRGLVSTILCWHEGQVFASLPPHGIPIKQREPGLRLTYLPLASCPIRSAQRVHFRPVGG